MIAERVRRPGRRSVQLLVSSVAGTKAGRQEKWADRANYGRNPEGFFLRVPSKVGLEANFRHPFFLPSRLTSCEPRKRKPFVRQPPSPSCSPQILWRSIRQTTICRWIFLFIFPNMLTNIYVYVILNSQDKHTRREK